MPTTTIERLTTPAPEGQTWVCGACGRVSRAKAGFLASGLRTLSNGAPVATHGWDESCMLQAVLCTPDPAAPPGERRWVAVDPQPE
jgi:hypothetical protein